MRSSGAIRFITILVGDARQQDGLLAPQDHTPHFSRIEAGGLRADVDEVEGLASVNLTALSSSTAGKVATVELLLSSLSTDHPSHTIL